eukprot:GDKI01047978.1.p1 GENE.GDKI01047978.1~~GDKI01047978.1.p1  ORF type:complete len:200 (+),score=41.29 GDKI01047978.1:79-600(+)
MASVHGCEVHAFDCTVSPDSPVVTNKAFTFHPVCIGVTPSNTTDTMNTLGHFNPNLNSSQLVFRRLEEVMAALNHTHVDVFKFDIEGSEWQLLADEIIHGTRNKPEQLLFELHTHYANPHCVPPTLVNGKHKPQVNQLFIDLFDLGYRVVSKEINNGDPFCAEFSLIRTEEIK